MRRKSRQRTSGRGCATSTRLGAKITDVSGRVNDGWRLTESKEVDKVQTLRALRVSPDEVGIGRRVLVLVRHGTGHHLVVLLSHDVSSPLRSSVLKPNLRNFVILCKFSRCSSIKLHSTENQRNILYNYEYDIPCEFFFWNNDYFCILQFSKFFTINNTIHIIEIRNNNNINNK